jgi:hypothetical protein
MNKTQLGEFVKSLEADAEVKEGRQYAEVTVPLQNFMLSPKSSGRVRKPGSTISSALRVLITDRIWELFIIWPQPNINMP